ncbi:MAG: hypothetical protein R3A12_16340 [Ignavibacteria bacterium]
MKPKERKRSKILITRSLKKFDILLTGKGSKGLKDKKGNFIIKSGATFKKDAFVNLIENQNYLLSEFDYDSEWSDNARANSV